MSLLVWISVGIVIGIVARSPIRRSVTDLVMDALLGLLGAASAGSLFNTFHGIDPFHLTLDSLLLALLGAVVLVTLSHAVTSS